MNAITIYWLVFIAIFFIVYAIDLSSAWNWWNGFYWIIYIFGVLPIWTAYKMAFTKEDENVNPESNVLYKLASRFFRIDPDVHSPRFFTRIDGKLHITNIFLALLVIGSTDILFAVDSIPAILFRYLKTGVSAILLFIGAKMLATAIPEVGHFFASHSWVPLAVIVAILIISILMSVLANERDAALERQQVNKKKQWNEE